MKTEFYEIYDYYYVPFWQTRGFVLTLIIFFLLCASITGFWLFLYLRKKRHQQKKLTPWEWAFEQLNKLSPAQCNSKNDFKKFYFDLTAIIKTYLYKRYGWKVLDKTDEELLEYVQEKRLGRSLIQDLRTVCLGALYIKFAGQDTLRTQAERDRDMVHSLVKQTMEIVLRD